MLFAVLLAIGRMDYLTIHVYNSCQRFFSEDLHKLQSVDGGMAIVVNQPGKTFKIDIAYAHQMHTATNYPRVF